LIPFEELALQTTLLYSPPEPAAAEALLAGIADAEQEKVSAMYLRSLLDTCQLQQMDPVVINKPLLPSTDRWPLGVDLRAALFQLQLEGSGNPGHSFRKEARRKSGESRVVEHREGMDKGLSEILDVARMVDVISSVDAGISRRPHSITEVSTLETSRSRLIVLAAL
jgi:hypothetical protein